MKEFTEILKAKREYYGNTEAAIEFAAEEYAKQFGGQVEPPCYNFLPPKELSEKELKEYRKMGKIYLNKITKKQFDKFLELDKRVRELCKYKSKKLQRAPRFSRERHLR